MNDRPEIHVVPIDDGRWGTLLPGHDQVQSRHETRKGAIEAGRREALAGGMELVIHDESGRICERARHGGR